MHRRRFALLATAFPLAAWASADAIFVRGKLAAGAKPELVLDNGARLKLTGDEPTMGVLADDRLQGADFEAAGHRIGDAFDIERIHTRSLFVRKDGKRLMVTYWCDVCYIRTYTPGKCWCCQKDTDLDLRESLSD